MLGILARDGGTVLWNDRPLNTDTCNVGYLAEERGLYPKYDLMDQLVYFCVAARRRPRRGAQSESSTGPSGWRWGSISIRRCRSPRPNRRCSAAGNAAPSWRARKYRSRRRPTSSQGQPAEDPAHDGAAVGSGAADPRRAALRARLGERRPVQVHPARGDRPRQKYLIMSSHQMSVVEEFCTDLTILHRSRAPCCRGTLTTSRRAMAA